MLLQIFDHQSTSEFRNKFDTRDEFNHSFGGTLEQFKIRCEYELPVHLIYRLDCRDPQLSFLKEIGDFVPLLYPYSFFDTFAYRISDDLVEVVHVPSELVLPPWEEAPASFPLKPITFSPTDYDPKDAMQAIRLKDIFGLSRLSPAAKEEAVNWAAWHGSLTPEEGWTLEDQVDVRYSSPFCQDAPTEECIVPNCDGTCKVIAFQEGPLAYDIIEKCEEAMWPEVGYDVQTIWQVCGKCSCLIASNQCT